MFDTQRTLTVKLGRNYSGDYKMYATTDLEESLRTKVLMWRSLFDMINNIDSTIYGIEGLLPGDAYTIMSVVDNTDDGDGYPYTSVPGSRVILKDADTDYPLWWVGEGIPFNSPDNESDTWASESWIGGGSIVVSAAGVVFRTDYPDGNTYTLASSGPVPLHVF